MNTKNIISMLNENQAAYDKVFNQLKLIEQAKVSASLRNINTYQPPVKSSKEIPIEDNENFIDDIDQRLNMIRKRQPVLPQKQRVASVKIEEPLDYVDQSLFRQQYKAKIQEVTRGQPIKSTIQPAAIVQQDKPNGDSLIDMYRLQEGIVKEPITHSAAYVAKMEESQNQELRLQQQQQQRELQEEQDRQLERELTWIKTNKAGGIDLSKCQDLSKTGYQPPLAEVRTVRSPDVRKHAKMRVNELGPRDSAEFQELLQSLNKVKSQAQATVDLQEKSQQLSIEHQKTQNLQQPKNMRSMLTTRGKQETRVGKELK